MSKLPLGLTAICIPDSRCTYVDRDTTTISASQASPRPGVAIADDAKAMLEPVIV